MRFLSALSLVSLALVAPAFAAEDKATGLAIDLSDEFVVEPTEGDGTFTTNFGIKFASGTPATFEGEDYLCQVSFAPAPENAALSKEEINTMVATTDWVNLAKETMSVMFNFTEDSAFTLGDINGHEFIATPKAEGAENVRLVLSMLETTKGRTAISCVADAANLEDALPVFRTIRDGVRPPV